MMTHYGAGNRGVRTVGLFLMMLAGLHCQAGPELGGVRPERSEAVAAPAAGKGGTPVFGYLVGYSNTFSTAKAMESIGADGYFAPVPDLKAGPQVLVEPVDDYLRHIQQALDAQITYAADNGLTPGFVYWMVGLLDQQDPAPTRAQVSQALSLMRAIRNVAGNIPLIVNPMSDYVDHVCEVAGPFGPQVAVALLDSMEARQGNRLDRIPAFPALTLDQTIDGCHATMSAYRRDAGLLAARIDSVLAL